jgi:hypothetical protein
MCNASDHQEPLCGRQRIGTPFAQNAWDSTAALRATTLVPKVLLVVVVAVAAMAAAGVDGPLSR